MPALSRWFSPIGGLAVALCATAGPGYLPTVGPAPIRFATPAPPAVITTPLPPLVFIEPRPAPDTNQIAASANPTAPAPLLPGVSPAESPPSNPADSTGLVSPLGPLEPMGAATNSPMAIADPEVVAPQMLLKYFVRPGGTNSPGMSIYAPVGFVPPQPLMPPSSSATFQTTPPAKP